jgi:hypothetical protein
MNVDMLTRISNYSIKMEIGKMTISEAYPYLKSIGLAYGLKLNRAKDFKFARIILANLYNRELV